MGKETSLRQSFITKNEENTDFSFIKNDSNFLVRFTIFKTILNLVNLILIRQYLYKRGLKFEDFKYLFKNTKHPNI